MRVPRASTCRWASRSGGCPACRPVRRSSWGQTDRPGPIVSPCLTDVKRSSRSIPRGRSGVRSASGRSVGVAPDAAYFRAAFREGVAPEFAFSGRGHYAGAMIEARFPAERPEGSGSARLVIPGVGTEVVVNGGPAQLARWDACPAQGRFLGLADSGFQQAAAYRWHAADPIPFVRPIRATIEPHDDAHRPTTKVPVALAVFWYTERPGPDPAGL